MSQLRIACDIRAGMEQLPVDTPRVATALQAAPVAGLLDAVNRESDTPTTGKAVLVTRLGRLLAGGDVIALLTGDPAVAVALLTLRPNVWYDGPVALLDELDVAPERPELSDERSARRSGTGRAPVRSVLVADAAALYHLRDVDHSQHRKAEREDEVKAPPPRYRLGGPEPRGHGRQVRYDFFPLSLS